MVDRKFVEAADALRFEMVNAHDGSFAPFVDRSLKDKIEAYDTARSRLAAAQPAEHPESIGGLASRTPASKQGKKALDDMLLVFAKHDDDDEDCWTQPARRAQLYVASLRADLNDAQVQEFMHRSRGDVLAEINAYLRAEVDRLRGAASVDVEARRLVDALTANGEHEFLIDEERVESLPDEQHNEIVYALRALRTALGAQG